MSGHNGGKAKVIEIVREKWKSMTEKRSETKKRKKQEKEKEEEPEEEHSRVAEKRHKGTSSDPIILDEKDIDEEEGEKEEGEIQEDPFDHDFVAFLGGDGMQTSFNFEESSRPPWMAKKRKSYISLDQELGDFCLWVVPTRKEIDLREETITRLNLLVNQTFGGDRYITCHNFGSWQLQLALPGSDLDFVLMGGGEQAYNPLRKMASSLRNKRYASSMNVIENTRVPIIKYTDIKTNIDCDISFDMEGGILMGACFSKILGERKMIHARKLVMLVKYWLRSRGLHEPFNGGMGSYSVLVLVISHIQHNQKSKNDSLATLFRSFFDFYGNRFNFMTTGISLLNGGEYFSKEARGGTFNPNERWKPALEDPCDSNNNISQASFQMPKIKEAFAETSRRLTRNYNPDSEEDSVNYGILNEIFMPPHVERIK